MPISRPDINNFAFTHLVSKVHTVLNNVQGGRPLGYADFVGHPHVNIALMEQFSSPPPEAMTGSYVGNSVSRYNYMLAVRGLAQTYSNVCRAVYGLIGDPAYGAYDTYTVGCIKISAMPSWRYVGFINNVADRPSSELFGSVRANDAIIYFERMWDLIVAYRDTFVADLRVCHGSCHSSCHGARGRR